MERHRKKNQGWAIFNCGDKDRQLDDRENKLKKGKKKPTKKPLQNQSDSQLTDKNETDSQQTEGETKNK